MSKITEVTTQTFQSEVKDHKGLVLLDFWAPWCSPCKQLIPKLEEISNERDDVKVVKVNVDDHPTLAAEYGVRGVPSMIFFKGGREVAVLNGNHSKEKIVSEINHQLKPDEDTGTSRFSEDF